MRYNFSITMYIFILMSFMSCVNNNNAEQKANNKNDSLLMQENDFKYDTVIIGKQVWMTRNLNVCVFRNGDTIFQAKTNEEWINAAKNKTPAWCYYNNNEINQITNVEELAQGMVEFRKQKYWHEEAPCDTNYELTIEKAREFYENYNKSIINCRKLYNWYAVNDSRGLAPEGWSIPNKNDFEQLKKYYGNPWRENFTLEFINKYWGGVNVNGFNACPCGRRLSNGVFEELLRESVFWTITSKNDNNAYALSIFPIGGGGIAGDAYTNGVHTGYYSNKGNGFSVRCIKN